MRLIDADRLIDEFEDTVGSPITRTRLKLQVENQPTIDAVEVVRCRYCKHLYEDDGCPLRYFKTHVEEDFCSYGERKDDG